MTDINIHCIVIGFALADELRQLLQAADAPNITWHLFLHSSAPEVIEAMEWITSKLIRRSRPFSYYPYQVNRGLSASWNDGIENAYAGHVFIPIPGYPSSMVAPKPADVAIIINDDMLPGPGDVQKVAQAAMDHPECGIIKCMGLDKRSGSRTSMEFGLTAITRRGWEVVGCFDENIKPIYWEDIDWGRRHGLSGLPLYVVEDTGAVHQGSKTSLVVPGGVALAQQAYDRNQAYYSRKWGGTHHSGERFAIPFNDARFGLKIDPANRHDPYPGYGEGSA